MEYKTDSPEQTHDLAKNLAQKGCFHKKQVVLLHGGLGAGKTAFVRGVLDGLGCKDEVSSPTFALCHRYDVGFSVLHYDLYRLHGYDDLYSIGFFEDIDSDACIFIEWPENAEDLQDLNPASITIERLSDTSRRISIEGLSV